MKKKIGIRNLTVHNITKKQLNDRW